MFGRSLSLISIFISLLLKSVRSCRYFISRIHWSRRKLLTREMSQAYVWTGENEHSYQSSPFKVEWKNFLTSFQPRPRARSRESAIVMHQIYSWQSHSQESVRSCHGKSSWSTFLNDLSTPSSIKNLSVLTNFKWSILQINFKIFNFFTICRRRATPKKMTATNNR